MPWARLFAGAGDEFLLSAAPARHKSARVTRRTFPLSRWAAVFHVLALIALATTIVLPRGYMAASGDDGRVRIVMCTGYGPVSVTPPPELAKRLMPGPHRQDDDRQDSHAAPCPYAGNAAPLSASGSYAVPGPAFDHGRLAQARPTEGIEPGRGMAAPPPPSQAPPLAMI